MRPLVIALLTALVTASCTTPSIIATREQQKGDLLFNSHEYDRAIEHYGNYLDASVKLGIYRNLRMEADVCRKIAHSHSYQGRFSEASEFLYRAILADSLDNHIPGIVRSYSDLGRVSLAAGRFGDGIGYLEHALFLGEGDEDSFKNIRRESAGNTYLGLAQACLAMGRFDDAISTTEKAHRLFSSTGYSAGLVETNLLLGMIYADMGRLNEAVSHTDISSGLSEQLGLGTVRQHLLRAELASMRGQFSEALTASEIALKEADRIRIIPQMIWALIRSGDLYMMLGDAVNAGHFYRDAERLGKENREALFLEAALSLRSDSLQGVADYFQAEGITTGSGLLYLKLAGMELENENHDEALRLFRLADSTFTVAGNNEGLARSALGMAGSYLGMNLSENAVRQTNNALRLSKNNETLWQCWYNKGLAMEMLNLPDSARAAYSEAIELIEISRGSITTDDLRGLYINDKTKVYDRLIRLMINDDELQESLLISEKARARSFLDLIGSNAPDPHLSPARELIGMEQELNLRLTHLQKQIYDVYFADHYFTRALEIERSLSAELAEVQDEYQLILSRLRINHPGYHSMVSAETADMQSIQQAIPSSVAVLQYWVSEEKIYLWIIRNDDLRLVTININYEEFHKKVRETAGALRNNIVRRSTPLLQELHSILIRPAGQYFGNATTLCIIPHGILHVLPFHALINQDGKYLDEEYYTAYMPSSSVMAEMAQKSCTGREKFLGMALGDKMIGLFSGLPGTSHELNSISSGFTEPVLAYEDASTEAFLRSHSSGRDIIHLATHGFFNEARPRYSFLLFTPDREDDGQLTVNEILSLDIDACMLTLSACETGVSEISKGDELTGLSRAFLVAGAQTVSVSLWSVADRPTAELMISFYKHLENESPHVAMTKARRETISKYPEPFYWAPFIVLGGSIGM